MQVILRHAKQERESGQNGATASHTVPLTDIARTHLEPSPHASVTRTAATPHHKPRPQLSPTDVAPSATTTAMQFAQQPNVNTASPSTATTQHQRPLASSLSGHDQSIRAGPLGAPPVPRPYSLLSDTSMTASLSLDDMAAREQERAAQRRRRGDVDRVLQIFDEVDAHFASLQAMSKRRAPTATTTTPMSARSLEPMTTTATTRH
ncbi:hypothetical protein pkur_cds_180 [Pandoravirus kuranda]|uniref:Uncharacterized protein n=1 Tax=Pandoravirus kuranda TaxID=3019033 RepID=A0AA95J6G3_9VIRU|nr:hypothetical protein pkur_cds_180 [Pandoravirus kuranda]